MSTTVLVLAALAVGEAAALVKIRRQNKRIISLEGRKSSENAGLAKNRIEPLRKNLQDTEFVQGDEETPEKNPQNVELETAQVGDEDDGRQESS